jgi:hypothetical protein
MNEKTFLNRLGTVERWQSWSNAPDLKSDELMVPGVRIPLSPIKVLIFCKIIIIGIVVQLVRALPCHGRRCGFESRQSRQIQTKVQYFAITKI